MVCFSASHTTVPVIIRLEIGNYIWFFPSPGLTPLTFPSLLILSFSTPCIIAAWVWAGAANFSSSVPSPSCPSSMCLTPGLISYLPCWQSFRSSFHRQQEFGFHGSLGRGKKLGGLLLCCQLLIFLNKNVRRTRSSLSTIILQKRTFNAKRGII